MVEFDLSQIRPKGAILKTFGGRASGPEPLKRALDFITETVTSAAGRQLTPIECHDILCSIGDAVVSGGVRRSALISLSDLDDADMARAKSTFLVDQYKLLDEDAESWTYAITMKRGQPVRPTYTITLQKNEQGRQSHRLLEREKKVGWWVIEPQRALANNSVAYKEKPSFSEFLAEMHHLHSSYSGERGIFFRGAAAKAAGRSGRRDVDFEWGTNPCSEIILRPNQFCNLSTVVVRPDDTFDTLKRKVTLAAYLGTIQATRTNFPFLSEAWTKNTEEERLLGVSLTGVMDHVVLQNARFFARETTTRWLLGLRDAAVAANADLAAALGIPQATAVTCVKPEGTVSQLTDTASGLHPRWAPYYIRRVRENKTNQLAQFMASQGVPYVEDKGDYLFEFPMKAPEGSVFRNDRTAVQQLEHWLMMQRAWTEHKPSITVYYGNDEFFEMAQWIWDHFDEMSGIALLPRDNGTYVNAPYEDITEDEYERRVAAFPAMIHWDAFRESEDNTVGAQTLACIGASCEIP
jgi:ribonucleoside-diphosphate reductase alpha chain